jgi:hypothetical protein
MKTEFTFRRTFAVVFIFLAAFNVNAQDKNVAKVDALIVKAEQATDKIKKTEYYNQAASLIMTAKLGKDQFVKIGDSYLNANDYTNASKYYSKCDVDDKKAGFVKIGHKMIEIAFDDPKAESKTMAKALTFFTKGGASAEGYEAVGDAYYGKGKDSYMKAADYYASGNVTAKLDKVAGEFIADNNSLLAADVYMKTNNEAGFIKAGDLYFNAEAYNEAFNAYDKAGHAEGIKKYADKLYEEGKTSDGDAQYTRVGEVYATKSNPEGLKQLAKASEGRGNFAMAATFYEKAGEADKAAKARALDRLYSLDFEGAKAEYETLGNADMIKAINTNMKYLEPLKDVLYYLDEVKKAAPTISYYVDTITRKRTPVKTDVDAFNAYYKEAAATIIDNCYIVSANVPKILHAGLKEHMMNKFKQYGAIRNVLDGAFGKKLTKDQATFKDVVL